MAPAHPSASARSPSSRASPGPPLPLPTQALTWPGKLGSPLYPRLPGSCTSRREAAPHRRGAHAWRLGVAGAVPDPHQFRRRSLALPSPCRRAPRPREAPHPAVPAAAAPPAPAAHGRPRHRRSPERTSPGRRAGRDRDARPLTSPESRRRRRTQPHQWG